MNISSDVLTTLYAQGTAMAFVIGLLFLSVFIRKRERAEAKIMSVLCIDCLIMCVFLSINVLMRYRTFPGAKEITLISMTISELTIVMFLYTWLHFVDYMIYGSSDHIVRHLKATAVPVFFEGALYLINLFTNLVFKFGIIFYVNEDLTYRRAAGFAVVKVIELLYLIATVVMIVRYRKTTKSPVFIKITPFVIPLVLGAAVSIFTDYSAHSLGIAVGLIMLHFSMMEGYCYIDNRYGCYNKAYLSYVRKFVKGKQISGGTGIVFSVTGRLKEFADILTEEKPLNADIVYIGEGMFLLISGTQRKSSIEMFIELVREAAEESGISFKSGYGVRNKDEATDVFLERLLAEIK